MIFGAFKSEKERNTLIRKLYASGTVTQKQLSEKFKISKTRINQIVNPKKYREAVDKNFERQVNDDKIKGTSKVFFVDEDFDPPASIAPSHNVNDPHSNT